MQWKRKHRSIGAVALFILAAFFIIRSDVFTIKSVEVQINKIDCTDENKIKDSSNIYGQPFFFIDSAKLEENLKKKFFCVKKVTLSKIFPDKVRLDVFGREPAIILAIGEDTEGSMSAVLEDFSQIASSSAEKYVVDNEGVVYSDSIEQINVPLVFISGFKLTLGQAVKEQLISNTLKILEKINSFGIEVKDAKIYSEKILLVNGTPRIIFKLDDKAEEQIASLQLILKTAKIDSNTVELVDLRFDKPVVKFASKKK